MAEFALAGASARLAQDSFPLWGTCAGMIVLAQQASDLAWPTLAALDITVRRNAFGRQVDSFETDLAVPALGAAPFHAVFIRAPIVEEVGDGVEVLATLEDGKAVAVRQANALATAFHPELTEDHRFHRYFMDMVRAHKDGKCVAFPPPSGLCGRPICRVPGPSLGAGKAPFGAPLPQRGPDLGAPGPGGAEVPPAGERPEAVAPIGRPPSYLDQPFAAWGLALWRQRGGAVAPSAWEVDYLIASQGNETACWSLLEQLSEAWAELASRSSSSD